MDQRDNIRVLYLLGIYRSGTTVLSNLLGQLDGFFCGGELMALWKQLLDPATQCGCDRPLAECELWGDVLRSAFGDDADISEVARRMLADQISTYGTSHMWTRMPSLLRRTAHPIVGSDAVARYAEGMGRLYRGIAEVTGARVIVDPSKEAANGVLLRAMAGVDPSFIHVVRDPRGTVYSSLRVNAGHREVDQTRWARSAYTAASWAVGNVANTTLCRRVEPGTWTRVRYEDFVDRPEATLLRLAAMVDESPKVPMVDDRTVMMAPTHTVAGNLNRFKTGAVEMRRDTSWQRHLHPVDIAVVTAVCAPLMRRYRYELRRDA